MPTLNYRADIDGLRAIAVLAVIICHANAQWLPGGFVGVDIFFVISGFLITAIIHSEIKQQSFSFRQFYLRRIKRILPLFFSVIIFTLFISYFLLSTREYIDFSKSVRYAISFMSNHYFAQEQDYFAPAAVEMPLLHMWSLAVEEQYYFLWPSLLLLITKKLPRYSLAIPLLLACASFVLSTFWATHPGHTAQAYYLLPSRFGELMIGSLLAIHGRCCNQRALATGSSWLGLLLIVISFIALDKNSVFPGYNALWPCIGTALIIFAGTHQDLPFINRLLASRGMVFTGLLSYSLYLWHWPILAFARYYNGSTDLSFSWLLPCLLLTATISYLSWRFIEKPLRHTKMQFATALKMLLIYPTIILFIFCALIKNTHGYLLRDQSLGLDTIDSPSLICHNDLKPDCHAGKQGLPAKTLIVGDSHTAHLTTFFDLLGKQHNWASSIMSVDSCPPLTQTDLATIDNQKQRLRCKNLIDRITSSTDQYNTVIYSLRWDLHFGYNRIPAYLPSDNFRAHLEHDIEALLAKNKTVFLVGQVPLYNFNVSRLYRTKNKENTLDLSYEKANEILREIDSKYEGVHYIDLTKITAQWHNGMINGLPAYKDNNHLNVYGQQMLAKESNQLLWISDMIKAQ